MTVDHKHLYLIIVLLINIYSTQWVNAQTVRAQYEQTLSYQPDINLDWGQRSGYKLDIPYTLHFTLKIDHIPGFGWPTGTAINGRVKLVAVPGTFILINGKRYSKDDLPPILWASFKLTEIFVDAEVSGVSNIQGKLTGSVTNGDWDDLACVGPCWSNSLDKESKDIIKVDFRITRAYKPTIVGNANELIMWLKNKGSNQDSEDGNISQKSSTSKNNFSQSSTELNSSGVSDAFSKAYDEINKNSIRTAQALYQAQQERKKREEELEELEEQDWRARQEEIRREEEERKRKMEEELSKRDPKLEAAREEENLLWDKASTINSSWGYSHYLEKYPNGRFRQLAIQFLKVFQSPSDSITLEDEAGFLAAIGEMNKPMIHYLVNKGIMSKHNWDVSGEISGRLINIFLSFTPTDEDKNFTIYLITKGLNLKNLEALGALKFLLKDNKYKERLILEIIKRKDPIVNASILNTLLDDVVYYESRMNTPGGLGEYNTLTSVISILVSLDLDLNTLLNKCAKKTMSLSEGICNKLAVLLYFNPGKFSDWLHQLKRNGLVLSDLKPLLDSSVFAQLPCDHAAKAAILDFAFRLGYDLDADRPNYEYLKRNCPEIIKQWKAFNSEKKSTQSIMPEYALSHCERAPSFPGGLDALYTWFSNFQGYELRPRLLWFEVLIDSTGNISEAKAESISSNQADGIVNLLKQSPKWNPGIRKGKKINVRISIPVAITNPVFDKNNVKDTLIGAKPVESLSNWINWIIDELFVPKRLLIENSTFKLEIVVNEYGELSQAKIIPSRKPEIDSEIIRSVLLCPLKWSPAQISSGLQIKAKFTVPVAIK